MAGSFLHLKLPNIPYLYAVISTSHSTSFGISLTATQERAGCPVIDVNGKFVGLALSRAGRTETYILPSWICRELVEGVLPKVQQYQASRDENIPEAQPVDDAYDARRLEENRRKVEDKMSRQGLVPKVY